MRVFSRWISCCHALVILLGLGALAVVVLVLATFH